VTQLSKQLSEHLVATELARRGIVATPFSGKVPELIFLHSKVENQFQFKLNLQKQEI